MTVAQIIHHPPSPGTGDINIINQSKNPITMIKFNERRISRRNYLRSHYVNPITSLQEHIRLLKINLNNAMVLYQKGVSKLKLLDFPRAFALFNQAIVLDPNLAIAYYCRGIAKFELGDYQGSIADNTIAISIEPTFVEAYTNRGLTKCQLGDYPGGMIEFNKAIEVDPHYARAYIARGELYLELGDKEAACLDLHKAGELGMKEADEILVGV